MGMTLADTPGVCQRKHPRGIGERCLSVERNERFLSAVR
jgi:hypothetical protein